MNQEHLAGSVITTSWRVDVPPAEAAIIRSQPWPAEVPPPYQFPDSASEEGSVATLTDPVDKATKAQIELDRLAMADIANIPTRPERSEDDGPDLGDAAKAIGATILLAALLRVNPQVVARIRGKFFSDDSEPNELVIPLNPQSEAQAPAADTVSSQDQAEGQVIAIAEQPLAWYELSEDMVQAIRSTEAVIYQAADLEGDYYQEHVRQQDRNTDPVFRAATVQIIGAGGEGSAALVELDGELYFRTIRHVLTHEDSASADSMVWVYMPGIGYTELPEYLMAFHEDGGDFGLGQDTNVLVPLRPQLAEVVRSAQAEGVVSPLTISTTAPADQVGGNYLIPNPETGGYIELEMVDAGDPASEEDNTHLFRVRGYQLSDLAQAEAAARLICAGFSGSPVLDGNRPGHTHGSASYVSYYEEYHDGLGRICSVIVGVQEN